MAGALDNGIYLRLPGQWDDGTWADATSGAGVYYNVHRWYMMGVGIYSRPDPLQSDPTFAGVVNQGAAGRQVLATLGSHAFSYAASQPLVQIDPLGLLSCDGEWKVFNWWRLGDPASTSPSPIPGGRNRAPLPPANRIPNARGPNPVGPPVGRPFQIIPPGICFCRWNCRPCNGESIYDPRRLPVTRGRTYNSGRDVTSGDSCLCLPPGPETGCHDQDLCTAPPILFPTFNPTWPWQ